MKRPGAYPAMLALAASLLTTAAADTPSPTEAEARARIEAQVLEQAQAKCASEGKVALPKHVKGAFMVKCVSPDDPEYKWWLQSQKPAQ